MAREAILGTEVAERVGYDFEQIEMQDAELVAGSVSAVSNETAT